MTEFTKAKSSLLARGVSIRFNRETGEYRVAFVGKSERYAAYTDDRRDAIATGEAMLQQLADHGYTLADLKADPRKGRAK